MKKIDISTSKYPNMFALVDDADYKCLSRHKWSPSSSPRSATLYATCRINGVKVRMHRFLMKPSIEIEIDHRDRNGLNNQRQNLRICTHAQNCANKPVRKDSFCGFKGVFWDTDRLKWVVRLRCDGKSRTVGRFFCVIKAARAYDKAAIAKYGEFACLNLGNTILHTYNTKQSEY